MRGWTSCCRFILRINLPVACVGGTSATHRSFLSSFLLPLRPIPKRSFPSLSFGGRGSSGPRTSILLGWERKIGNRHAVCAPTGWTVPLGPSLRRRNSLLRDGFHNPFTTMGGDEGSGPEVHERVKRRGDEGHRQTLRGRDGAQHDVQPRGNRGPAGRQDGAEDPAVDGGNRKRKEARCRWEEWERGNGRLTTGVDAESGGIRATCGAAAARFHVSTRDRGAGRRRSA